MKEFLVLGLMPYFTVSEYDVEAFDPKDVFEQYIVGVRDYGRFQLRPVGVKRDGLGGVWEGWSTSAPEDGRVSVAARQSVYHLTIYDDELREEDFTDTLVGIQALMYDFVPEDYVLLPIDPEEVPADRILTTEQAVNIYARKFGIGPDYAEHSAVIATKHSRGHEWDQVLWGAIKCLAGDEQAVYALLFLRAALEHVMFYGADFTRAIQQQEAKAERIREAVDIENSIHNCYKVMEAIYGGTFANDWRRVERTFKSGGVDLSRLGGFSTPSGRYGEEPLIDKLKRLKDARDDRAAHGRIHADRRSTYYELMDYQMLASSALSDHIKHKYPDVTL